MPETTLTFDTALATKAIELLEAIIERSPGAAARFKQAFPDCAGLLVTCNAGQCTVAVRPSVELGVFLGAALAGEFDRTEIDELGQPRPASAQRDAGALFVSAADLGQAETRRFADSELFVVAPRPTRPLAPQS